MLAKERKLMALRGKLPSDGMALNIGCGDFNYFSSIKGFKGKIINCDKDFSPVRWFLRIFNYLDVLFCNGKGHMIFAVLNPLK